MISSSHFATAVSAFATGFGAVLQAIDLIAAFGASFANSGADGGKLFVKRRAAQHKVTSCLTDFCTAHHQLKVPSFHVVSASFQTMGHCRVQAAFMTLTTCIDTCM